MLLTNIFNLVKGKHDVEKLNYLKSSTTPLYIWGDGQYSHLVIEILNNNGIPFNGIFTDKIDSKKYALLEQLRCLVTPFNIIVGHGDHTKLVEFIKPQACVDIVVLFDVFGFEFDINQRYIETNQTCLNKIYNSFEDLSSKAAYIAYLKARYTLDWKLIYPYVSKEPYFEKVITQGRCIENIIDVGAFRGDSIIKAIQEGCKWNALYAFEPNPVNFKALVEHLDQHNITNVTPLNLAVDKMGRGHLFMDVKGDLSISSKEVIEGNKIIKINTTSIDSFVNEMQLNKVDYIIYDVEGAEPDALLSAAQVIIDHKPVIKLSVYHRRDHLYELFNILTTIRSDYRFIFRLYNKLGTDAVLIAY